METPSTSVASADTMIAPKRAVMIDGPIQTITYLAGTGTEASGHPSQAARGGREQRRRAKLIPVDRLVPHRASFTCSTCRITFLPFAVSSASTSPGDWVCDLCLKALQ